VEKKDIKSGTIRDEEMEKRKGKEVKKGKNMIKIY
jgi:hypothetical protein